VILDIRYFNPDGTVDHALPEQIQGVRLLTVYARTDGKVPPEFVIRFYDNRPTRWICQKDVFTLSVTND
jgi:hypothetical protein